jgi:hypothetical protein
MPTFVWVIGCPRSGTTFLTRLIGENADLVFDEPSDPKYERFKVDQWEFPDCESLVFKWCENYLVARKILDKFPTSYFLHTIREPRNNVYSIAVPKPDTLPHRDFPEVGKSRAERALNSIEKWHRYTSGCLGVREVVGERYLAVPYENMPDSYGEIEKLTGIRLERRPDFRNTNVDEEALAALDRFWSERPEAERLRDEVEELRQALIAARRA